MTAPVRRRPLPALALIGVLTVLTAFVWFRVIHRDDTSAAAKCPTPTPTPTVSTPAPRPTVLPFPRQVSVLVLNSTQRGGLAGRTSGQLEGRGFHIAGKPADDGPAYGGGGLITGVGAIRYGSRALAAATLLSYYFPGATLQQTAATNTVVIVSLGRGFTAVASQPAVAKALRDAGAHLSRTVPATSSAPTPSPSPSRSAAKSGC